jgi:hypothetical protein
MFITKKLTRNLTLSALAISASGIALAQDAVQTAKLEDAVTNADIIVTAERRADGPRLSPSATSTSGGPLPTGRFR